MGRLRLIASDEALVGIWFEHGRDAARGAAGLTPKVVDVLAQARAQLEEYFAGSAAISNCRWIRAARSSSAASGSASRRLPMAIPPLTAPWP